jgi:hypothetical protein
MKGSARHFTAGRASPMIRSEWKWGNPENGMQFHQQSSIGASLGTGQIWRWQSALLLLGTA